MRHLLALCIGFAADFVLGDPHGFPHIVIGIGKLISGLEKGIRRVLPKTPKGERAGGVVLVVLVCAVSFGASYGLLWLCAAVNVWLALLAESYLCWQCLAVKALKDESTAVQTALEQNDLPKARQALSMIVGRDTRRLDREEIARAAVETVAENAADGVVAPLLYLVIGGGPLGVLYKAINTMDSMLGYKNEKYLYLGRCAARLDDVAGFLPARLCGLFTVLAAPFCACDEKNAWKVYKRDRKNHASPNSAHSEAAFAGAMGLQLGGDSVYFGKVVKKPTMGDLLRTISPEDIHLANRLLYAVSILGFTVLGVLSVIVHLALR